MCEVRYCLSNVHFRKDVNQKQLLFFLKETWRGSSVCAENSHLQELPAGSRHNCPCGGHRIQFSKLKREQGIAFSSYHHTSVRPVQPPFSGESHASRLRLRDVTGKEEFIYIVTSSIAPNKNNMTCGALY